MMKQIIAAAILLACCALSCQGPAGPSGSDSLFDASIQPKVVYTYPPPNSQGPYNLLSPYSPQLQIRFNKFMDPNSVKRALSVSSPNTFVRVDTSNFNAVGGDLFLVYLKDSLNYSIKWKIKETYTLTVSSAAKDVNGNSLQPPYSMTFTPEPSFRINYVYPPEGAENLSADTELELGVNSPVDTSFLSKIQVSPAVSGGRWRFEYSQDSTFLLFSFPITLRQNTQYSITIPGDAHDKYGNTLPQPFSWDFSTAPFEVSYTNPVNGAASVASYSNIYIDFTGRLDTGSIRRSFKITPWTAGYLTLYPGATEITFLQTNGLLTDTEYTVLIDTSIRSVTGERMSSPFSFTFTTTSFQLEQTSPRNGETSVSLYSNIYLSFTAPIDTSTVRTAFAMKDSLGNAVPGYFDLQPGGAYLYFDPQNSPLMPLSNYGVTISTALKSIQGKHLKAPYTFSFFTGY